MRTKSDYVPTRELIDERLRAAQGDLFWIQGIIGLAMRAARDIEENQDPEHACDVGRALEAAHAMMEAALVKLDVDSLLAPAAPESIDMPPLEGETRQ